MKNMHIRLTVVRKKIVLFLPLFLYPSLLKTLILGTEVGMRFKALHNEKNTKCSVVEIRDD